MASRYRILRNRFWSCEWQHQKACDDYIDIVRKANAKIAPLTSALAAATERAEWMKQRNEPLLAVLLTEFGYPDDGGTCVPEFAARVLHEQRVNLAAALASLRAAEEERDRLRDAFPICHVCKARVGEHHQPFCSVEPGEHTLTHAQFMSESRLAAARADAVKEAFEWLEHGEYTELRYYHVDPDGITEWLDVTTDEMLAHYLTRKEPTDG
jgi:hypothetical protein